jgi:sortase A
MRCGIQKLLSFLLLAGGALLLFLGAREFLGSRSGQVAAAREFQSAMDEPAPPYTVRVAPPRPGETFARLIIPRLDTDLYIVEGDDDAELRRGPGHITGSALPGSRGNCIIAGHRDTHFRVLKDIREGDDIVLQTPHGQYLYRVRKTRVISTGNVSVFEPTPDPQLSLITCYPFYYVGSAPKRFVVEARLAGAVQPAS